MSGQQVGYVRVSTTDQNTARQLEGVDRDRTFEDHASGKNMERPELEACLNYLRSGDTLHCHSIDRLARNLQDLLKIISDLIEKGVTIRFHKENLTFSGNSDPFQTLQLQVIAAVAQFERALILERQREGIAIAKKAGKYKNVGRKPCLSASKLDEIRSRLNAGDKLSALAKEYEVSRQTIYNIVK